VHALAGIGNPSRFFDTLRKAGLHPVEHAFPDHHRFSEDELVFDDQLPLIMTEKDAVKCMAFAKPHYWYLMVYAAADPLIADHVYSLLKKRGN
jgi:tetraacyldisaccharide 4'-kinase